MDKNNKSILIGSISLIIGILLTTASYTSSDTFGSYRIFYGAVIWGIYKILKGLYNKTDKFGKEIHPKIKVSNPYATLGLATNCSDEELNTGYKQVISNYNSAIQSNSTNLDEFKTKLYAYRTILEHRDFTKTQQH